MSDTGGKTKHEPWGNAVLVEFEDGIAWVSMNRPDKRNAMNPVMNREMNEVLDALEVDDRCRVLVLTGSGESFSAGMDLKEYFRETDDAAAHRADARAARRVRLAGPEAHEFREAHHRHGERLVLRRRLHAHGVLRSGHRRRRGDVRRVGDQLGHPARRQRVEGAEPAHGPARRALCHHDRHSLQREKGRGDGPGQRVRCRWRNCATARGSWRRSCSRRTRPCCTRPRSPSGTSRTCPGTWRSTISAPRTSRAS